MTVYVTKSEFTTQKARLTRAKNSGNPLNAGTLQIYDATTQPRIVDRHLHACRPVTRIFASCLIPCTHTPSFRGGHLHDVEPCAIEHQPGRGLDVPVPAKQPSPLHEGEQFKL